MLWRTYYIPCDNWLDALFLYFCGMTTAHDNWFATWFNSPYYHILYKHRNLAEAAQFIDNLIGYLQPDQGTTMLDLACGRGRHSLYLCQKGYTVTGVDLSPANIRKAQTIQCGNLDFAVHDMRKVFRPGYFDYVFNFFTSFYSKLLGIELHGIIASNSYLLSGV